MNILATYEEYATLFLVFRWCNFYQKRIWLFALHSPEILGWGKRWVAVWGLLHRRWWNKHLLASVCVSWDLGDICLLQSVSCETLEKLSLEDCTVRSRALLHSSQAKWSRLLGGGDVPRSLGSIFYSKSCPRCAPQLPRDSGELPPTLKVFQEPGQPSHCERDPRLLDLPSSPGWFHLVELGFCPTLS